MIYQNKFKLIIFNFFVLILFLSNIVFAVLIIFSHNTDVAGIEPNVIFTIQEKMIGHSLYSDPEKLPYAITQYSPAYYQIVSKICKIFNVLPGQEVYQVYVISRSVSFVFALLTSVIIFFICYDTLKIPIQSSFCVSVLSFIIPAPLGFIVRPDILLSLSLFLTIYIFLKYLSWEGTGKLYYFYFFLSTGFAILSLFVKQSGLQILIILGGYLLFFSKSIKKVFLFTLMSIFFASFFYLIFLSGENLEYVYKNIVGGLDNGIDAKAAFFNVYYYYFSTFMFLTAITVVSFIGYFEKSTVSTINKIDTFLLFAVFVMNLFAILIALKAGSARNYVYDVIIFQLIFVVYSFKRLKAFFINGDSLIFINFFLVFFLCFSYNYSGIIIYRYIFRGNSYQKQKPLFLGDQKVISYLKKYLTKNKGIYFYSESRNINNYLFDRCIMPQSEIVLYFSHPRNSFNYSNLRNEIENGKIKLLVLSSPNLPKGIAGARLDSFKLLQVIGNYSIFLRE